MDKRQTGKLIARLKNHKLTLEEITDTFHLDAQEILQTIEELKRQGVPVSLNTDHSGNMVYHLNVQPQAGNVFVISQKDKKERVMTFGASSDLHFASIFHLPKTFYDAMKRLEDKGVTRVYVAGDIIDGFGIYSGHLENLAESTVERQTDLAAEALAKHPHLEFWGIAGNHSLHKDTEVLTPEGWKKVSDCTKDTEIGQFDINTKEISFSNPDELENHFEDNLYCFDGNDMHQEVSWGHHLIINNNKMKATTAFKMPLIQSQFPLFVFKKQKGISLTDAELQLIVWVVCDGTIVNHAKYIPNSKKIKIQFKLSKERKIKRLTQLLTKRGIKFTFTKASKSGINKLQPHYVRIYGDDARAIYSLLNGIKRFPKYFIKVTPEQAKIIYEELLQTDASLKKKIFSLTSINKEDLDILQQLFLFNKYVTKINKVKKGSGFPNGKQQYELVCKQKVINNCKVKKQIKKYNDLVYCFVMPKGTLITRFNGKIALTGNCYSFTKQNGVRPLALLEDKLDNFKNLGELRADVIYHGIRIRLLHGAGGRSYSLSYPTQCYLRDYFKGLDRSEMGQVPHVMIVGHYHTQYFSKDHGVYILQPGSFQSGENEYCARRGLTGPNGCFFVTFTYKNGQILTFQTEYIEPQVSHKEKGLIAQGKRIDLK